MKHAIYSALITAGLILIFVALTINNGVDDLIVNTAISVAFGTPLTDYKDELMAIMAGGKLLVIPLEYQLSVGFLACFMIWIGAQGFCLDKKGLGLSEILKKKFWTEFQNKFYYEPDRQ
jgi:hypothetical protein